MNYRLAQIAEQEAKKNYHGNTDAAISNLQPLADAFDVADDVTLDILNQDWSGAFAFLCVQEAGFGLPVRYPDPRVGASFAFVGAWERYAKLPKISLWHRAGEPIQVGDLVVFDTPEDVPACMGIVLRTDAERTEYAVGNYRDHSAVIERETDVGIRGFIRLRTE